MTPDHAPDKATESWGSDFEAPQKKSRLPVLAWVLGSGCFFLLILVVVAVLAFGRMMKRASDPEIQWPKVAEVLPFDEPPAGIQVLQIFKWGGTRTWLLFPRKDPDFQVLLLHVTGEDAQESRAKFFGKEAEVFTLVAQGRELPAVRAASEEGGFGRDTDFRDVMVSELASGPCLRLDLSPPGSPDLLMLQWTDMDGAEPVDEQRVLSFLEPFDLGSVR
jgi:hypothetical protein